MTKQLVSTTKEGAVLVIRLCSPENRNSLTAELRQQIGDAVATAESDSAVRAAFLTAEGPTFCSGGDLSQMPAAGPGASATTQPRAWNSSTL